MLDVKCELENRLPIYLQFDHFYMKNRLTRLSAISAEGGLTNDLIRNKGDRHMQPARNIESLPTDCIYESNSSSCSVFPYSCLCQQ